MYLLSYDYVNSDPVVPVKLISSTRSSNQLAFLGNDNTDEIADSLFKYGKIPGSYKENKRGCIILIRLDYFGPSGLFLYFCSPSYYISAFILNWHYGREHK